MYKLIISTTYLLLIALTSYSQLDSIKTSPSIMDTFRKPIPKSEWGSFGNTLVYSNDKFYTLNELNIDTETLSGMKVNSIIIEKDKDRIRSFLDDKIIAIIFINDSTKIQEMKKEK